MVSDVVLVALIGAAPAVLSAFVGLLNHFKIIDLRKSTDGMKDQLVAVTRSDALQEGETIGREKEQAVSSPTAQTTQQR